MASSAPIRPIEVPPFIIQPLISTLPDVAQRSHPTPDTAASSATARTHRPTGSASDFDSFLGQAASSSLNLFSRVTGGVASSAAGRSPDQQQQQQQQQQPPPVPGKREITTAQALNKDIFVGSSDGSLIRYSLRDDDFSTGDPYCVVSEQVVPGNKPVDKIVLIPSLSKALVLSGGILYFYTFPALDPIPHGVIAPARGVATFAVDEAALNAHKHPSTYPHGPPPVRICIVRRRSVVVFALRDRLQQLKDIPLPNGAIRARLAGSSLFIADNMFYYSLNVETNETFELIQWAQVELEPGSRVRPSIVVVTDDEFMLVSWTGAGSLGFFFSGSGDPCRGTLEWPQHPVAICVDYPYITSLLPNQTLEIHNMESLSIVAVLSVPTTLLSNALLSFTHGGYLVPSIQRNLDLQLVPVRLLPSTVAPKPPPKDEPPSGSGLTPPTTPVRTRPGAAGSNLTFTRSRTLLVASTGISGLLPSTLVAQIDSLLLSARIEDAIELTEQARKKAESIGQDQDETIELQLIYQKIGYKCLKATRFEDAGNLFLKGDLDPRLLIRLFPDDLRGSVIAPGDEIDVFTGVYEDVESMTSIDEIVMANLVRNYHPHIQPSVEEAPPAAELRRVLEMTARDMLKAYLRKWSSAKRLSKAPVDTISAKQVQRAVDTVLAKLYAGDGQRTELITLIETSQDNISIDELESVLIRNQLFAVLARIYEKKHDQGKLLDIWTRAVDGEYVDPALGSPMQQIITLLTECKDRVLVQRYGIWLVKHDPSAGLKLFISRDSKKGMKMDDSLILRAIRAVDPRLGEQYLEHLALGRRNVEPGLHTQLATTYIDRIVSATTKDANAHQAWTALVNEYSTRPSSSKNSSNNSVPFLEHLASGDLDPDLKVLRLKLCLLLQGSLQYDIPAVRERVFSQQYHDLFVLEQAIIMGKLREHRQALDVLVLTLGDPTTAESYCNLGGEVISAKLASSVSSQFGLELWGNLVIYGGVTGCPPPPLPRNKQQAAGAGAGPDKAGGGAAKTPSVDDVTRKDLIKILMQVYMDGGEQHSQETAQLLNSQAMNLDVVDVLSAVPSSWSLNVISSFLSRSFRRALHDQHEGLILKNLAAGQNLEVSLEAYDVLRMQGAVIEEALQPDDDGAEIHIAGSSFQEKQLFTFAADEATEISEKTGLPPGNEAPSPVSNVPKPIPLLPAQNGGRRVNDSPVRGPAGAGVFPGSVDSSRTIDS